MKALTKEEIDQIATKYIKLQEKAKGGGKCCMLRFEAYQNICAKSLKGLIVHHTRKYRKFSNHIDLEQDGFEALINALGTFNPEKGSFCWWANRYIKTRVQRRANAHSTIRFPIKKAKEVKPYKVSTMPIRIDLNPTPLEKTEQSEDSKNITKAIKELTEQQRRIINMRYGFNGIRERTIGRILEELSISRQQYSKLLSEAENKIKRHLLRVDR